MLITSVKCIELNKKIVCAVLNTQAFKMIWYYINVCVTIGITKKKFDENLEKKFAFTYKFSNHDVNEFILFLRKPIWMHG